MILSVLYGIKHCSPMNIKFHESTKQKNGIQLILIKPQEMNSYCKTVHKIQDFNVLHVYQKKKKRIKIK